jgi:hypothetical protein
MNRFRVLRFRVLGIHLLRARMAVWRWRAAEDGAAEAEVAAEPASLRSWRWSHLAAAVSTAGIMAPTAAIAATNHPYPPPAPPPPST